MPPKVSLLRSLTSALIERYQFARQHGLTFGGKRDLYDALGYQRELKPQDYRGRYERGGLAARVVEALPRATWRGSGELVEDEDPDRSTPFEETWNEMNDKLQVWAALMRADIIAGLGRYSVLLIGAKGELDSELPKGKPGGLLYLTPFAEDEALIESFVTDPQDERFGLPERYLLKRVQDAAQPMSFGRPVHWSRVIHVADQTLDDVIFGLPRLERVWNYFDDLEKVSGGGAEAFWLRAHQGFQFDLDPTINIEPGSAEETELKKQVDEFTNGIRRAVQTRGIKLTTLGSDVANFASPVDAIVTLIAGATGIPKRILVGSEMGELASSQDRSNWRDQVQDRREGWAGPSVVRPFVDRLIKLGYLPEPKQYEVRWPTIQFLDETERADVAVKWAQVNQAYGGEVVIEPNEIRDKLLDLPPLEVRQEALVQPAPEVAAAPIPKGMKPAPEPAALLPGQTTADDTGKPPNNSDLSNSSPDEVDEVDDEGDDTDEVDEDGKKKPSSRRRSRAAAAWAQDGGDDGV